ncbi:MAG: reverse transcriptase [Bdellovibrionaceae bacterium]|jgi:RNA-directed DNA polymerase|nr:reverse transcriptase [Pseudobdellovibrionaceae bacterium]
MNLSFEEVVKAYIDCRRHKRNTHHALVFEFDLEKNLFDLYEDLINGSYKIGRSIVFMVDQPKVREIWAAEFRDRVVHHIIYNRLYPRFYPGFIRNTFACIPNRGSLDASNRLGSGLRSITQNWQKPSYFLGADVRNFFISIHKPTLFEILQKKITEQWLLHLVEMVIFHDPRKDCWMKSKKEAFNRVPRHKSLWHTPLERGLPIGNLTSQFFANVYLNELDQFAKHKLKAKYYYRYVDDFIILNDSPDYLNDCFKRSEEFLVERLKIELHPFKKRLRTIDQGVDFVGYFHKPYRRYTRKRTVNRLKSVAHQWNTSSNAFSENNLKDFRASMNSYYGLLRQSSSYNLRKNLAKKIDSLFLRSDEGYTKFQITKS